MTGSCCGHGDRVYAYIGWEDGPTIREFIVDDGSWKLNVSDWIPEEDEEETIEVTIPVHPGVEMTPEDYESFGRFVYEMAEERHENRKKIRRAVS